MTFCAALISGRQECTSVTGRGIKMQAVFIKIELRHQFHYLTARMWYIKQMLEELMQC